MSAWTEDRIARLKTLWPQGHTAAWIAVELGGGLSRSAVLAKVWRLGLSAGRATAVAQSPDRPPSQEPPQTAPMSSRAGLLAHLPLPDQSGRTILSVRRTGCRWPYGDPKSAGFTLCGCRVSRGPYCAAHAAVAYRAAHHSLEALIEWATAGSAD